MTPISRAGPADLALMLFVAIIWASAFIAIKVAVPETGPVWLAAIRVTIGALALLPYALAKGLVLPETGKVWLLIVVMACFNVVIPFFLISWAELTIDAGVTSLLMGTGPFLALIGSHFFTRDDRINGQKALAVLFGFSGVLLVVGWDAVSQIGTRHTIAQLAALGGSVCYVIGGLIIRRINIPPTRLAFIALTTSAMILIPIALIVDGPPPMPSAKASAALAFLGLLPTGLAYILRFHLIRKLGYSTFALSLNLIPVFGILLGFLLLGEPLHSQVIIALLLILTGFWFSRRGSTAPDKPEPQKAKTEP